ncbi:MAG: PDZ domain-containing protein, partial [Bdellovibrionales bacterium]|nr:PDZ domain-containing protein [Bdellovibrionales bacterium]
QKGALILEVVPNTPAEKAGIKIKDLITRFNNKKIKDYKDLFKAVASTPVNKTVPMELIRNGKKHRIDITVAERKELSAENTEKPSSYGKKKTAPFDLGIVMVTGTKKWMESIGLPPLNRHHPIVTEVKPGSPAAFAGIRKKDIILKVNGWQVQTAREVQRRLSRNRTNTLNILRYRPYSRQYINMIFQLTAR